MIRTPFATTALLCLVLGVSYGCAAGPATDQYLDLKTGATIHRVARPLLLSRPVRRMNKERNEWAQLAPVVINRAGEYRTYLWVELPDDNHQISLPVFVDEEPLNLALATKDRRSIAVGEDVYANHSTFGYVAYYHLSDNQLSAIVAAASIRIAAGGPESDLNSLGDQLVIQQSFSQLQQSTR